MGHLSQLAQACGRTVPWYCRAKILKNSCQWRVIELELELELIQSHMAQKPVLRDEVGCACVAREVSVERGGMGKRGCARRLGG